MCPSVYTSSHGLSNAHPGTPEARDVRFFPCFGKLWGMVKSMTGFGRGSAAGATHAVTVEIATVNRKQFDATLWLPREWMAFEARLLGVLREGIARGAVKCSVTVKPLTDADATQALAERFRKLRAAAEGLGLRGEGTLSDLIALGATEEEAAPEPTEALWEVLAAAARKALEGLRAMRLHEGERIAADLRERLGRLRAMHAEIAELAPTLPAQWRDTLKKRIEELLPERQTLDEGVLEREVALFAERVDIAEELTRLSAHFAHAETLLSGDAPCGRALDFLCQEFFREINTTGSKCGNGAIARTVIAFKTLLETVREQVQNLE